MKQPFTGFRELLNIDKLTENHSINHDDPEELYHKLMDTLSDEQIDTLNDELQGLHIEDEADHDEALDIMQTFIQQNGIRLSESVAKPKPSKPINVTARNVAKIFDKLVDVLTDKQLSKLDKELQGLHIEDREDRGEAAEIIQTFIDRNNITF